MGLPYNPIAFSSPHQLQTLLRILHDYLIQPFHVYAILFILMDQQLLRLRCLRIILKQIRHLFIVQLQERAVNLDVFSSLGNQPLE